MTTVSEQLDLIGDAIVPPTERWLNIGTVTSVNPLQVAWVGEDDSGAEYPRLDHYFPILGDTVKAVKDGTTWLIIGSYGGVTSDTGWLNLVPASGWTLNGTAPMQARMINGQISFQGGIQNSSFSGGYTTGATLPAGIPAPVVVRNGAGLVDGATMAAGRGARVGTSGQVQFATAATTILPFKLDDITYLRN